MTEKHEVCALQKIMEPNGRREQPPSKFKTGSSTAMSIFMHDITVQKLSTGHKRQWSMNGKKEEEEAGEDNTCFPLYPSSEVNVH